MTSVRRRARRAALQAIFEVDQAQHDPADALAYSVKAERLPSDAAELANKLVQGVLENKERIDAIITGAATAWPIDQMAATDRVALEIGIFEVCVDRCEPLEIAINEAVELAKVFGGENSASFVNGVLRTIAERETAPSHAS
jgi:N utilization substance protein B